MEFSELRNVDLRKAWPNETQHVRADGTARFVAKPKNRVREPSNCVNFGVIFGDSMYNDTPMMYN